MEVIFGFENLKRIAAPAFITLGAFDGVHLAHQKLIRMLVDEAASIEGKSVLITFDPLPRSIIHTDEARVVLTSIEHKLSILAPFSLDYAVIIHFDKKFARITAEKFIKDIVLAHFPKLRKFIIGPRAHFGHNAEGTAVFLESLGKKYGFDVAVTKEMVVDDAVVSSSVIRKYVRSGELDAAEACLGRKYSLYGKVIKGERIGRKLGFPTANIDPQNEVYPPSGVYAVEVRLNGETCPGVLNIGFRPTLNRRDDLEPAIEVHLIGFKGELYGRCIEVIFYKRLRQEEHFASKEELMAQIQRDVEKAKRILAIK